VNSNNVNRMLGLCILSEYGGVSANAIIHNIKQRQKQKFRFM